MDKYEVTNAQYKKYCDATGRSHPKDPGWDGSYSNYFISCPDYPVVNVSWNDAVAYATWASKRLPTEAEWEKAARGTDGRKYPWGNSEPNGSQCNFADSSTSYSWREKSANDGYRYISPVGSFQMGKSPYGLYDMAGNVAEWCADMYGAAYYNNSPTNNPKGPTGGSAHVARGGAWNLKVVHLRSANRA